MPLREPVREITGVHNPLLKEYRMLAGSGRRRRRAGKLAIEGPRLLNEALKAGLVPEAVFFTREYLEKDRSGLMAALPGETKQFLVSPQLFSRLSDTETPQGVAAMVPFREREPAALLEREITLGLLIDRLQDPGNMGTIMRVAAAAGVEAFFYTKGCADPFSPKVLRSTAGAVFTLPAACVSEPPALLQELRRRGLQVVLTAPEAKRTFWEADFSRSTVLLVGNESRGVDPSLGAAADEEVYIPQFGAAQSLNAAVAAGIVLYEAVRQRRG